jgi:hypothetical protein
LNIADDPLEIVMASAQPKPDFKRERRAAAAALALQTLEVARLCRATVFNPIGPPLASGERRAGGEAPRTTSPSAIVALRTLATDGV